MNALFHASKQTGISLPFPGFERSVVVCQLVNHTEKMTQQMFVIAPCSEKRVPIPNSKVLLLGSKINKQELVSLNLEQTAWALSKLIEISNSGKEEIGWSTREELEEAQRTLSEIQRQSLPVQDVLAKLHPKLGALINSSTQIVESWDFQFKISGVCLRPVTVQFVGLPGSNDKMEAIFRIDISVAELKQIRLLDDVSLHIDCGDGPAPAYKGVCTKLDITDQYFTLRIESHAYEMRNSVIPHLSTSALNPFDLVHFISRSGGLDDEHIKIPDFKKETKTYTLTVPIEHLQVLDPLGIGNVMFMPAGYDLHEILRIGEVSKDTIPVFSENSLAVVHIEATSAFDAYVSGKNQIEQCLDVLLHLIRSDVALEAFATTENLQSWERSALTPKPRITTWMYLEEAVSGQRILTDTSRVAQPDTLTLTPDKESLLESVEWYESLLLELIEKGSKPLKPLFNALKWLRRSWDADDTDDKIIFAIIALEFVANGETAPPVIPPEYKTPVLESAVAAFKTVFVGESDQQEQLAKKLRDKLSNSLSDAPLRAQIQGLIQRLEIPISDSDVELVFKARALRNKLVHGPVLSGKSLVSNESQKLVNAVGILVAHKLYAIYKEGQR
ncbi:HEPN domain-containing protein [Alicyclobacillus dauci]|uniref:HEPN domain-containing protein n=1 Tax=Alicyclobacillus dauci TaxID=1475485 RepID=A0ABY6Z5G5_9BACL|nr:HEPN domain-containing protein [Alicyclobacillus dauci]WAH38119.1 HEPN domain-containing protein [Alicyclobacillus dauci]